MRGRKATYVTLKKPFLTPGAVAHACNPRHAGDGYGRSMVQGTPRQKVSKAPISINNPGMVEHVCSLSDLEM
jgi:hypothetical protein